MIQTPTQSAVESVVNVAIGYVVSLAANATILPLFGIAISLSDNLAIGSIYTIVSIARSYCVRRAFNHYHGAKA